MASGVTSDDPMQARTKYQVSGGRVADSSFASKRFRCTIGLSALGQINSEIFNPAGR